MKLGPSVHLRATKKSISGIMKILIFLDGCAAQNVEIAENGIFEPSSFIRIGPVDSQIFLHLCEYWLIFGDFSIHFREKVQRLRPVTSLQPWAVKTKVNPF